MNIYERLTPGGPAAIAIVRLRGPGVGAFVDRHLRRPAGEPVLLAAGRWRHCRLLDEAGNTLDDIVAAAAQVGPEWDICLHLHGGSGVQAACRALLERSGFREQLPDVASLWQATDAYEAELWQWLPQMRTLRGARWLAEATRARRAAGVAVGSARLEETIGFRLFSRPTRIALVGPVNVGKSTLMNQLARTQVSIVSPTPGTTRDWVDAPAEVDGLPVTWLDTAGLRTAVDEIEAEGVRRSLALALEADAVLLVLDAAALDSTAGAVAELMRLGREPAVIAWNKSDLVQPVLSRAIQPATLINPAQWNAPQVALSALTGAGIDELRKHVLQQVFPTEKEWTRAIGRGWRQASQP